MCRELQTSWQAIALEFNFGARQRMLQTQRLMPPEEKNLCLSFEIKMAETRGTLNLAIPAVVSNALLRKISADFSYQRRRSSGEARRQHPEKTAQLLLSRRTFHARPASAIAEPQPNSFPATCFLFARSASAPAVMLVGDVRLCSAAPVRVGDRRAARVSRSLKAPDVPATGEL